MSADGDVVAFAGSGVSLAATRWPPSGPGGVALLLLHGGGQTRRSWGQAGPRLAALGFDVISLDARGHGDSDWSPDGFYGSSVLVDDLLAVVRTLPQPPIAIGASMGGMTALIAEGEHPGLLRARLPTAPAAATERRHRP